MKSMIEQLTARLGVGLHAVSLRERALVSILFLIGVMYLTLLLFDWSQSARNEAVDARATHAQVIRERDARVRGSILGRVEEELEQLRADAFLGETYAIARLTAESTIETLATAAGVQSLRVSGTLSPETSSPLQVHLIAVQGRFDWDIYIAFLAKLSQLEQSVAIVGAGAELSGATSFQLSLRVLVAESR